jgi:hypothetical protein
VRNAREEARQRVGGRHDVRVLEPSPPAVTEPPWFADDPLEGGEVLPIERAGARTWLELSDEDRDLRVWCQDRWLVRKPLVPLPASFATTRESLHALAEHVIAPARFNANGKIGLRFTFEGFGTPFFGDDRQVRVEDGRLVDGDRVTEVTTLAAAGAFVGVDPATGTGVYQPTTDLDLDAPLPVDAKAAHRLGDWYGFCASVLEQFRADATEADAPARVQLWPEHFDIAVDLGPDGRRANFGGSPGDDAHPQPYLYVSPWDRGDNRENPYWNEPFGASLGYAALLAGADPLDFLRRGKALL